MLVADLVQDFFLLKFEFVSVHLCSYENGRVLRIKSNSVITSPCFNRGQ